MAKVAKVIRVEEGSPLDDRPSPVNDMLSKGWYIVTAYAISTSGAGIRHFFVLQHDNYETPV